MDSEMASVQATIPFKLRKKTYLNKKVENADENVDITNTQKPLKGRTVPKRRIKSASLENEENDTCSAVKRSRPQQNEEIEEEQMDCLAPLTSREKEIEWMFNFLMEHLESQESASLYVSGQPGTGKSASLSHIMQHPKVQAGYRMVAVNCTAMKSAASVFARVCGALGLRAASHKASRAALEAYLYTPHQITLVVLDEIDQLDSKRQEVLYTLFEWAAIPETKLVLIGVANALDLTQRALPRLQTRHYRPQTLHFPPYSKEQIVTIFTKVLADEDKGNMFSPAALQMLAAKIAAVSGDMRRALDIGRRVIELARRSKFADNQSVEAMLEHSTVTVELKQVLQVLNTVYGGSQTIEKDDPLPMQQKLILCSLILMLTKGKNKNIVMGKLHDVYKKVASARNIAALDISEVCGACSLLEARGALRLVAGGGRARRLTLLWDHADLAAALSDQPLLAAILRDTRL